MATCKDEELIKNLTNLLTINDASKLCPMLTVNEPAKQYGQRPIEVYEENKFKLPVAWHRKDDRLAFPANEGKCSCRSRTVEISREGHSDFIKPEPGLDYLPLGRLGTTETNQAPVIAPFNAATNTVCTCPQVPLALLSAQDKSSLGKCRCADSTKQLPPKKVTTGTTTTGTTTTTTQPVQKPAMVEKETQSEPKPANQSKPVKQQLVDKSKCKQSKDGTCPCCKKKSKGNKKTDKQDDTKADIKADAKSTGGKSTISLGTTKTIKKIRGRGTVPSSMASGVRGDNERSDTDTVIPLTKKASQATTANDKRKYKKPAEFAEESKSSLSSGPKVQKNLVKGMYPGMKVGHQTCCLPLICVPKTMGWLWNHSDGAGTIKPGLGWRPGAIKADVYDLMVRMKKLQGAKEKGSGKNQTDIFEKSRTIKAAETEFFMREEIKQPEHVPDGKPTLHLHKSGGRYNVVMHPPAKRDDILFSFDKKAFESCTPTCEMTSTVSGDSLQFDFTTPYSMYKNIPLTKKACVKIQKTSAQI